MIYVISLISVGPATVCAYTFVTRADTCGKPVMVMVVRLFVLVLVKRAKALVYGYTNKHSERD